MRTYKQRTEDILKKTDALQKTRKKRKRVIISLTAAASAAAVLIALNLTLFVPYSVGGYDLSAYRGSEYYSLMEQIGSLTYGTPRETNNFLEWGLDSPFASDGAPSNESSGGTSEAPPTSSQQYEEVTNNQVKGVIEGDLLKRSDKYLYYLAYAPAIHRGEEVLTDENGLPIPDENGEKQTIPAHTEPAKLILHIYTVSGEKVNTYEISGENTFTYNGYGARREMYLTEDCTKILVLVPYFDSAVRALCTRILGIDVSDPASPREFAKTSVSGDYVSSRLAGNTLLLVSNFKVAQKPDFSAQAQYLPRADGKILPMEDIVLPEQPSNARYTILSSFAVGDLTLNGCEAYFDFSDEVYVSEDHIFTTRERTVRSESNQGNMQPPFGTYTDVACTAYDGISLTYRGEVSAYGTILNQYSLDEYEGVLRMFTTGEGPTCNFYCFDLSDFTPAAPPYTDFAPEGESIRSVRFDGNFAYVCTASVLYTDDMFYLDDPVYEFDLRDYSHITSKDTGEIIGYSEHLVPFFGETLLGIGFQSDFGELKLEVYDPQSEKVEPVARFCLRAEYSRKFKAYFIDRENGLVGLMIFSNGPHPSGYLLIRFDGRFTEITTEEISSYASPDDARACMIGGTLYIFLCSESGDCVLKMVELG